MDRAACCVCFLSVWKSWSAWVDVVELDSLQARDAQRQHTVHCSGQAAPQHKEFCNCVAAAGRDWAGPGWPGRSNTTPHSELQLCGNWREEWLTHTTTNTFLQLFHLPTLPLTNQHQSRRMKNFQKWKHFVNISCLLF